MRFQLTEQWRAIQPLVWADVPSLAIITGKNGAGKSQLLRLIAIASSADYVGPEEAKYRDEFPMGSADAVRIHFEPHEAGKAIYAEIGWPTVGGDAATTEAIRQMFGQFRLAIQRGEIRADVSQAIAEKLGFSREQMSNISVEDAQSAITPYMLWGGHKETRFLHLANSVGALMLAYRIFEQPLVYAGKSIEEIEQVLGQRPWVTMNEILAAAGLPYTVVEPGQVKMSAFAPDSYGLTLRDMDTGTSISPAMLSSGESVILATALWIFASRVGSGDASLLILDEPDAQLHPSMAASLIKLLSDYFVKEKGIRVILTTHSPSTVAVAPPDSLFLMRRDSRGKVFPVSTQDALEALTEGFETLQDGIDLLKKLPALGALIFTEGHNVDLLKAAFDLYGIGNVEVIDKVTSKSSCSQLSVLYDFLAVVPHKAKAIFVLDSDVKESKAPAENLLWLTLPRDEGNSYVSRGIESSFPEGAFDGFLVVSHHPDGSITKSFSSSAKKQFAKSVSQRKSLEDFRWFASSADQIKAFLL